MTFDTPRSFGSMRCRASVLRHREHRSQRRPATFSKCPATVRACSGFAWVRTPNPTTASSWAGPRRARSRRRKAAPGRSPPATRRSRLRTTPLRFRLLLRGVPIVGSITDEHFRGWTRLPAFARVRQGGHWTAALALASGEPVYGLGEKFGPLNKRGQLIHSRVEDALGVNTGLAYKNAPFAWSPGTGKGAWGLLVHTPASVTHGVGHPDWSHRSYVVDVEDEALDLFLFAADAPAGILDLYTQLTGRAATVPLWSLGLWVSRAYYKTPEEAAAVAAKLRLAPDSLRRVDARRPRRVEGGDARRFRMGRRSLSRSARGAGRDQGPPPADLRLGISLRVGAFVALRRLGVARLPPDHEGRRTLRVRLGYGAGARARSARC